MGYNEDRAEALRKAAYGLGDMLAQKAAAYGNAQDAQRNLWRVLLQPYLVNQLDPGAEPVYALPPALLDHVPRLTRVLDRICRIVANPSQDRMGEDTWKDLAGDAVAGMVMPRTCKEPGCERTEHPATEPHMAFDARGVSRWSTQGADFDITVNVDRATKGVRMVASAGGHEGEPHPQGLTPMAAAALDGLGAGEDTVAHVREVALSRCRVLHRLSGDPEGVVRICTKDPMHGGWHKGPIVDVL